MEELRSTQVLDREIEEQTEEKIKVILESAKENAQSLRDGLDLRIQKAVDEACRKFEEDSLTYEKKLEALVDLEEERLYIQYIHNSVIESFNKFFSGLSEEKVFEILGNHFKLMKSFFTSNKVSVMTVNLDGSKVKKYLEGEGFIVDSCESMNVKLLESQLPGFLYNKGFFVESKECKIKANVTLDIILSELLSSNSYELSCALFGQEVIK